MFIPSLPLASNSGLHKRLHSYMQFHQASDAALGAKITVELWFYYRRIQMQMNINCVLFILNDDNQM